MRNSSDIKVSNNKGKGTTSTYAIKVMDSNDGGSEHMVRGNEIMFNRDSDQGYGIYLNGTKKVRLIRNDVQGIGTRVLSHPYATFNASSTTLIHNTYDSGTPRLALDDTVIDYK